MVPFRQNCKYQVKLYFRQIGKQFKEECTKSTHLIKRVANKYETQLMLKTKLLPRLPNIFHESEKISQIAAES